MQKNNVKATTMHYLCSKFHNLFVHGSRIDKTHIKAQFLLKFLRICNASTNKHCAPSLKKFLNRSDTKELLISMSTKYPPRLDTSEKFTAHKDKNAFH